MKSPEQKTNTPAVSERRRDVILEKIKISKQDRLAEDITLAQKLEQEQGPFSNEVLEKKKEIPTINGETAICALFYEVGDEIFYSTVGVREGENQEMTITRFIHVQRISQLIDSAIKQCASL